MSQAQSVTEILHALLTQTQQRGGSPSIREIGAASLAVSGLVTAYAEVRNAALQPGMSLTLAKAIENADNAVAIVKGERGVLDLNAACSLYDEVKADLRKIHASAREGVFEGIRNIVATIASEQTLPGSEQRALLAALLPSLDEFLRNIDQAFLAQYAGMDQLKAQFGGGADIQQGG